MPKFDYDLFVIGGGSGGVRSARLAAGLGVRTAIAEEYRFGGTCVVRGCVPKKLFVYASEFGHAIDDARAYGWTVGEKRFDWKTLVANKDVEIARLSKLYSSGVEAAGGTVIRSRAEVVDPHTIKIVSEGRTVTAERILVATGGHPFVPEMPGKELAITSNEAFHLEELPRKIVIVGGGYIAIEFAGIFHGLGRGRRTPLSRRRNPSWFRSRSSRASHGNHARAGRRDHLQHRAGRYRENARGLIGGHEP